MPATIPKRASRIVLRKSPACFCEVAVGGARQASERSLGESKGGAGPSGRRRCVPG